MIKLSKEAHQVLQEIIENEDTPDYWEKRCTNLTKREDSILRGCFSELKRGDMVSVRWADGYPDYIQVHKDGYLYDDHIKEQARKSMSRFEMALADLLQRGEDIKKEILSERRDLPQTYLHIIEWKNHAEIIYYHYLTGHLHGDKIERILVTISEKNEKNMETAEICENFLILFAYFSSVAKDKDYIDAITAEKCSSDRMIAREQMNISLEYDVFLSHANADKENFVDQLSVSLKKLGLRIFYDKTSLEWGDNWKDRILEGTKKAEFAIIVISENFFDREWTEKELTEFLSRQNRNGQKLILPIIHNITNVDLRKKYPSVADIQTIDSQKYTCDEIALLFARQLIKRLKMES